MGNEKLKNIISLIKTKKLFFILMTATLIMFASTFWYPLIYLSAGILLFGIITLKFEDIFCVLIYMTMFGVFLVPFIAATIAGFLVILIKYIIDVKNKKVEFFKTPFIITSVICTLFSIIHYEIDSLGLYQGLMIIGLLYFIYFVIIYRKQLIIKKCFNYLFLGLIASSILSIVLYLLPMCQTLIFDDKLGYIMIALRNKVAFVDGDFIRVTLLSFHVNHLSAFCLFAMAYSSIKVLTKKERPKKEKIYYIIMYALNLIVGLLTLSKAFIVVFACEVIITIIYYIATHKKQALKIIGILTGLFLFFVIVFRNRFIDIFERFFVYNYDTLLGMITTGRSGIWQQYANAILESPLKLLFGFGLFSKEELLIGPHNFYIFILYRFGLVGIMLLAYLVYSYFVSVKTNPKFSIKNSLIFITFLIIGLQEACIDERFYFFIIGLALIFLRDSKTADKKQNILESADKLNKEK